MEEIWKDIKGYEGKYQVSNLGRVRGLISTPKILTGYKNESGYMNVSLEGKQYKLHRLVAGAFIPNPENKPVINHINENKLDNRACNLEWKTHKENINHNCLIERTNIEREINKGSIIVVHNKHSKQIVGTYNSQADVCRALGIHRRLLHNCLKGGIKQTWKDYFFNRL